MVKATDREMGEVGDGGGAHLVHEIVDGVGRSFVESKTLGAALVTLRGKTCQSATPLKFLPGPLTPRDTYTCPTLPSAAQPCPNLYETNRYPHSFAATS